MWFFTIALALATDQPPPLGGVEFGKPRPAAADWVCDAGSCERLTSVGGIFGRLVATTCNGAVTELTFAAVYLPVFTQAKLKVEAGGEGLLPAEDPHASARKAASDLRDGLTSGGWTCTALAVNVSGVGPLGTPEVGTRSDCSLGQWKRTIVANMSYLPMGESTPIGQTLLIANVGEKRCTEGL